MTDEELAKLAAVAAPFGNCNEAGLLQMFKVVRDATARAAGELCDQRAEVNERMAETARSERIKLAARRHSREARYCANAIRAHFHLAPTEGAPRDE